MTLKQPLEFEKPVAELESQLREVKGLYADGKVELKDDIKVLEKTVQALKKKVYSRLTPWQVAQLARHPNRPYTLDYVKLVCDDFVELHGDRKYKDDPAIVGGLASIGGASVMLIGHQKGRSTKDKIYRNFGMPNPEGYRKGLRLMKLAERLGRPVVTFIDTPGAFPGIGAEERGQSEAIAENLMVMSRLKVPVVSVVIGEGGSGGALAIGVADRVIMMEYSIYSVISPEGCAAILWRDGSKADVAAEALKIGAKELLKLGVVDKVIKEPLGGAHSNWESAAKSVKKVILASLDELKKISVDKLVEARYNKYRKMGKFLDPALQ
ncbi:MAG: acetyl-CoA carboxylase carboxyltransferase subunit alpha [Thermodesulfobacteriota bacterium]